MYVIEKFRHKFDYISVIFILLLFISRYYLRIILFKYVCNRKISAQIRLYFCNFHFIVIYFSLLLKNNSL